MTFVRNGREALAGVDTAGFSRTARGQLAYHLLLNRFIREKTPIANLKIPGWFLDGGKVLLPGLETEVRLLRYEIELAQGNEAESDRLRKEILAAHPHDEMLLDFIRSRGGYIARFRKPGNRAPGRAQ